MILAGKTISPGRAKGIARVVDSDAVLGEALKARSSGSTAWEIERLRAGIARACVQLGRVKQRLGVRITPGDVAIFDTHAALLRDPALVGRMEREIRENGRSADAAVAQVVRESYAEFSASATTFLRDKAADMFDIGRRLIYCLSAAPDGTEDRLTAAIVVAREVTPSDLVRYVHQGVKAIVSETCGRKSHTAILARSLAIPMLTAVDSASELILDGCQIVVDAQRESVLTAEDAEAEPDDDARQPTEQGQSDSPSDSPPAISKDGVRISLLLNISAPADAEAVRKLRADGVGLFRTEFLYMGRSDWPSEDEIFEDYRRVTEVIGDAELGIRLADFGAEKCPPYADVPVNRNPSLGLRGLRLLLQRPDILGPQVRALLRLGSDRPLTVLLPMLDSIDTLDVATNKLCRIAGCREPQGLPFRLGAMIETPSAAIMADEIIARVDALAIGLNDLTQYTLAADRDDELVEAYHDAAQPAVLRLVRRVVEACQRQGKPVSVCGELAGNPALAALLLALGLRRFSVSQVHFREMLSVIRRTSVNALAARGATLLTLGSAQAIRQALAE